MEFPIFISILSLICFFLSFQNICKWALYLKSKWIKRKNEQKNEIMQKIQTLTITFWILQLKTKKEQSWMDVSMMCTWWYQFESIQSVKQAKVVWPNVFDLQKKSVINRMKKKHERIRKGFAFSIHAWKSIQWTQQQQNGRDRKQNRTQKKWHEKKSERIKTIATANLHTINAIFYG